MPTSRAAQRLRSLFALVVLLAIAIGIPLVLIRIAGWPLPSRMPKWDRVVTAARQNDIPAAVVIKTLAVIVWIAWAQLVWALAWEIVVNTRRYSTGRELRSTPLVLATVSGGMSRLVAMLLAVGISVASPAAPALHRPATAAALVVEPIPQSPRSGANVGLARPVHSVGPRWQVMERDTLWDIAEHALGDGSRASEIIELNASLTNALDVAHGQVLHLPSGAKVPADRVPHVSCVAAAVGDGGEVVESSTLVIDTPGYLPPETITIHRGDNLWRLSEHRLDRVDDDVTDRETFDYLKEVIAANPDVIEDPNLIFPGEQFDFPAIGSRPTAPDAATSLPPPDADPKPVPSAPESTTGTPSAPTSAPPPVPTTVVTTIGQAVPPTTVATEKASDPSTELPASTPPAGPTPPVTVAAPTLLRRSSEQPNKAPLFAGVASATILATGIALGYRRRRRWAEAATNGTRRARVSDRAVAVERELVRAGDMSLVRWAHQEIGDLCERLSPRTFVGVPVIVEISAECGLEILWDQPILKAPSPWEAENDGWTWRLLYDPDHHLASRSGAVPIPGLVSVGTRDGNIVMVNLEAFGTITITGAADRVRSYATSLVVEIANDADLANGFLHVAGLDVPAVDLRGRIFQRTVDAALQHAHDAVADHERVLMSASLPNAFALRLGGDAHGRELSVAVIMAADANHHALLLANHGGACIVVGDWPAATSTLHLADDGTARIEPTGLTFTPHNVPLETIQGIADELEAVDQTVDDEERSSPAIGDDRHDRAVSDTGERLAAEFDDRGCLQSSQDPSDSELDHWERPAPTYLVRVLGRPRIDQFPKVPRLELNIAVYLACHGGRATNDQLMDAIWDGTPIGREAVSNRLSKARSHLKGVLDTREHGDPYVRLCGGVMTDLAMHEALVARSEQVPTSQAVELLREALDLVEGIPFDAGGYDWAHTGQFHKRASDTIEDTVLRLIDVAVADGDIATARHAVCRGLQVIPGDECLYRARMNVESAAGNRAGIVAAYEELLTYLSDERDDRPEPMPPTRQLFERLTTRSSVA